MSISKFQEKYLRKGCGTLIVLAMAAVFLGFGFNSQCSRYAGMNPQQNDQQDKAVVAKVGDVPVTADEIQTAESQLNNQAGPSLTFAMQAQNAASAVYGLVSQAAYAYIAQRDHIPITDDALLKGVQDEMQQKIDQEKQMLMITGKAKDPKGIDAAFKAAVGKTPEEVLKNTMTTAREALSDKDKRSKLVVDMARQMVEDAYAAKSAPSDQELQASYQSYIVKRIMIASGAKNPDVATKAAQVEASLKSGTSFEQAIDRFSADPPPTPGKKASDNLITVSPFMLQSEPEYKELTGQKPGFVSSPVSVPGGMAIFKLISIRSDLPKDYQTNIAKYKSDYAKKNSDKEVQKQVDTVLEGSSTTWENAGEKALYEFYKTIMNPNPGDMNAAMRQIADDAKAARAKGDPAASEPATFAWYLAFDNLYTARHAEKAKMLDERIDVLNAVLTRTEDFSIRMELADLYTQKKDGSSALNNLIAAVHANTDYAGIGTQHFGDIMAKRAQLVKLGLVTADQLKDLDTAQASWRSDKADADKQAEETKREMAKQQAADAELQRQNAAELAKQKAQADKNAPPSTLPVNSKPVAPTKGGSLLPPGTVGPSKPSGGSILPPGTITTQPTKGPGGH